MDAFPTFRRVGKLLAEVDFTRLVLILLGAMVLGFGGWYIAVMTTRPCGDAANASWHLRIREDGMGGFRWTWSISPDPADREAEERFLQCLSGQDWNVTRPYNSDLVSADRGRSSTGNSDGGGFVFKDGHYEEM